MDGKILQDVARAQAQSLPDAKREQPFGPQADVFKVHNKIFVLLVEEHGRPVVVLKSDPADATALREQYTDITPGYHMNKEHWITLAPGDSINQQLVEDLVTNSYRLVVNELPAADRPTGAEA
ncbi:MmcQ/YjbR family DNA-binding protein [Streptomyces sp. NPDC091217]|uniref:MmcQ/YjbR family DNA-binding protein n=1 Tax=Streptomyces sp. NPDC091217 TaxID=3365975 RepID=UPI00381102B8